MNADEFRAMLAKDMTEKKLSEYVRVACKQLGLLAYHTHSSRFSAAGYPDWHIVGPTSSLYRELKTEKGRLSADQSVWLEGLVRAGYDAGVWRPSDWFSGRIACELKRLAQGSPDGPGGAETHRVTCGVPARDRASVLDSGGGTDRGASAHGPAAVEGGA